MSCMPSSPDTLAARQRIGRFMAVSTIARARYSALSDGSRAGTWNAVAHRGRCCDRARTLARRGSPCRGLKGPKPAGYVGGPGNVPCRTLPDHCAAPPPAIAFRRRPPGPTGMFPGQPVAVVRDMWKGEESAQGFGDSQFRRPVETAVVPGWRTCVHALFACLRRPAVGPQLCVPHTSWSSCNTP